MKKLGSALAMTVSLMLVGVEVTADEKSPKGERFLANLVKYAIIITPQKCDVIGPEWKPYERLAGRFPLAVGIGTDIRNESKKFHLGNEGGEYRHVLTVKEMPKHRHQYKDRTHGAQPQNVDHGDDRAHELDVRDQEKTETSGEDQPHNNMPPYLALNFCHKP